MKNVHKGAVNLCMFIYMYLITTKRRDVVWMRVESLKANLLATALREGKCHDCRIIFSWIITCFLTHLLTPWSRVVLEKLTGFQLVKTFHALYWTRRIITAFTSARQLSLFWASSIQSIPSSHFLTIYLILSFHLCLGSPKWFPHQNPVYISPLLETCYMPRLSHSSRLYHPNSIRWGLQIIKHFII